MSLQQLLPNSCDIIRRTFVDNDEGEPIFTYSIVYSDVPCSIQQHKTGGRFLHEEAGTDDFSRWNIYINGVNKSIAPGDLVQFDGMGLGYAIPKEFPFEPPGGASFTAVTAEINAVINEAGRGHHTKLIAEAIASVEEERSWQ